MLASIILSPCVYSCQACVVGGTLASIASDYRNRVDLLAVYLSEAHPTEGWALGGNVSTMKQHNSLEERIVAAQ